METGFPIDAVILLGAALVGVGIALSGYAGRLRVPALLLFLGLGMLAADDGLAIVEFDDARLAQNVAVVALAVILFEGGLATTPASVRRVAGPAAVLATVGVVVTAAVVAGAAVVLLDLPAGTGWLIGAVVASTDAAAVFGALRHQRLPERVRDLLQVE